MAESMAFWREFTTPVNMGKCVHRFSERARLYLFSMRQAIANVRHVRHVLAACLLLTGVPGCHKQTKAPSRPYDTSCRHDWECTPAPECCVAPCSSDVINANELQRAQDDLSCDSSVQCPVAGGCPTFAYLCVQNECKIAFEGDAVFRKREIQP